MTLLATTDLSVNSKAGLRFAIQFARQTGSQVIFYHMMDIMRPTSWSAAHFARFREEEIARRLPELQKFIAPLCKAGGLKEADWSIVVETGYKASEQVISYAKKQKVSFICMCTRGAGMVTKLFGTTASALITGSPVPVIVVPHDYKVKPLTCVLYASDFAALKKELEKVTALARSLSATTEVIHYDYLINVPEVEARLKRHAAKYTEPGVDFKFRKLEVDQSLSHQLRTDIKRSKPSLVVLFTKQHSHWWFDRILARSDSADLSFNAGVPLLTFRKKGV
jgi:nucleotide-binding universal stress UspA family protein